MASKYLWIRTSEIPWADYLHKSWTYKKRFSGKSRIFSSRWYTSLAYLIASDHAGSGAMQPQSIYIHTHTHVYTIDIYTCIQILYLCVCKNTYIYIHVYVVCLTLLIFSNWESTTVGTQKRLLCRDTVHRCRVGHSVLILQQGRRAGMFQQSESENVAGLQQYWWLGF